MLNETDLGNTIFSVMLIVVILSFSLLGLFCYYVVISFIDSKTIGSTLVGNIFLRHLSVCGQVRIPICSIQLILIDVLKLRIPFYVCVSRVLNNFLFFISVLLALAIGIAGFTESIKPNLYLTLPKEVGMFTTLIIGITSVLLYVLDSVGWCHSWNMCSQDHCQSTFLPNVITFMLILVLIMMLGLMIESMKSVCNFIKSHGLNFLNQTSQVTPIETNEEMEMSTISVSVQDNDNAEAPNIVAINQEQDTKIVSPAIHLLTFALAAIQRLIVIMVCDNLGGNVCVVGVSFIGSLVLLVLVPAVWIMGKSDLRQFAFRIIKDLIG